VVNIWMTEGMGKDTAEKEENVWPAGNIAQLKKRGIFCPPYRETGLTWAGNLEERIDRPKLCTTRGSTLGNSSDWCK